MSFRKENCEESQTYFVFSSFASTTFQSIQKEVDLPIVRSDICQNNLRATRLGANFTLDSASFLCAGGEANKGNTF